MEHTDAHELSAAYALDALDEGERREFEEHLRDCERCQRDLADLSETAALLAYGAPATAAPESLRSRILDEVGRERQVVVPLRRPRLVLGAVSGLAAAAAAVAVGLGLWAASLSRDLDSTRAVVEVLADPSARTAGIQGAAGRLVVDRNGRAALVVRNLASAPAGRTYEIWVIEGDAPRPAGLFDGGDARDLVLLESTVPRGAVVAVTVEVAGGVEKPTGKPVFTAQA